MSDKYKNKYRIPSSRLIGWDYGLNSSYFVTICTQNRTCFFGDVINEEMVLNEIGKLANDFWLQIPEKFPFAKLHNHVIMPNHMHGIIIIDKQDDADVQTRFIASPLSDAKESTQLQQTQSQTQLIASLQDNANVQTRFIASPLSDADETTQSQETQLIASLQDNPHVQTRFIASQSSDTNESTQTQETQLIASLQDDANVQTRFIASPLSDANDSTQSQETQLIASLQDNANVQTRFIASPLSDANESTQSQETQLIASLQDNAHVQTRFIASPSSDANVQTRLIASLPDKPIGGITGNHNPMLHDNLSKIIRWYKGRTAFESRKINIDFAWQSRFHDHIIRNDESFQKISEYITNNPANWCKDQFYK